jgi:hypothetical protein
MLPPAPELAVALPSMQPADGVVAGEGLWVLANGGKDYLVWSEQAGATVELNLPEGVEFDAKWIRPNGRADQAEGIVGAAKRRITLDGNAVWLSRKSPD